MVKEPSTLSHLRYETTHINTSFFVELFSTDSGADSAGYEDVKSDAVIVSTRWLQDCIAKQRHAMKRNINYKSLILPNRDLLVQK